MPVPLEEESMPIVTATRSDTESLKEDCSITGSELDKDMSDTLEDVTISTVTGVGDAVELCQESNRTKKINALKEAMGSDLISRFLLMAVYERRSVLTSFCEDHSRQTIQTVLGIKVSSQEWGKILEFISVILDHTNL